jgi:hypothetical protein
MKTINLHKPAYQYLIDAGFNIQSIFENFYAEVIIASNINEAILSRPTTKLRDLTKVCGKIFNVDLENGNISISPCGPFKEHLNIALDSEESLYHPVAVPRIIYDQDENQVGIYSIDIVLLKKRD